MMSNYIPVSVTNGEKRGFSAPDASWFKGESIDFVKERIMNSNSAIYGLVDYSKIRSLVQEHLEGKRNRRLLIWSLLNIEEFLGQFS